MEVVSQLQIAKLQGFLNTKEFDELYQASDRLARILSGLRSSLSRRHMKRPSSGPRPSTLDPRLEMFDFFYNTLSPWQWGLLALVPPAIVALYFLKLKRQPLEVPSTYLVEEVDRGHARQQPVAAAAAEFAVVFATAARSPWRCSRCCGRVGKARSSTAIGSSFWSIIRPACRPPTSTEPRIGWRKRRSW